MTQTRIVVGLVDTDGNAFEHVVEHDLQPGVRHMIAAVRPLAEAALAAWTNRQVDRALVTVSHIHKHGEQRMFTVDAVYPGDGGEFGDMIQAVDSDDAEFGIRWTMAENDRRRARFAEIESFTGYMTDVTVEEVFDGERVDPTQALHALYTAIVLGDGVDEARELAATALAQAGYDIDALSAPAIR